MQFNNIYQGLISGKEKLALVGLGYVGMPIAVAFAKKVDVMIIVGGKHSSNTKKLYEICRNIVDTQFLQTADDLDWEALSNAERIGITAGASTPHYIIEEVQRKCQKKVLSKC